MVFVKDLLESRRFPYIGNPFIFGWTTQSSCLLCGAQVPEVNQRLFPEFPEADGTIIYTKQVPKVSKST